MPAPNGEKWGLGELLHRLTEIEGLARLRYTTSHPRDMDDSLIEAHRDLPQLMPYLHLPIQSGSNRILKAMNRRHTTAEYIALIARIKAARPDLALSAISSSASPARPTRISKIRCGWSRRSVMHRHFRSNIRPVPERPAPTSSDQVPEDVKAKRLERLQALLLSQQNAFAQACIGKTIDLLLEKPGRMPGQLIGRSPWLQSVNVDAKSSQIGDIVSVRITGAGPNSLFAEVVS